MGIKNLKPEIILVSLLSLFLCLSPWTGQFSFEYSFFLSIGLFPILTFSSWIRFRHLQWYTITKIQVIRSYLALLLIPVIMVLLFSINYGICSFSSGLIWFLLLPTITTIYCVSCGVFASSFRTSAAQTFLIAILPTVLFSILTLYDLYVDPALQFYHPVVGYFPGPVYDEWIPRFLPFYTYRFWILTISFWFLLRGHVSRKQWMAGILILFPLFLRPQLKWHYSHAMIQEKLGMTYKSLYADIYFPPELMKESTDFGDFIDQQIKKISWDLKSPQPDQRIKIYVYPNAYLKKKWTGTLFTLVGNPMQRTLHLLSMDTHDPILIHELTHVIASPMGIPFLHISPKIGLLEGLATAVQQSQLDMPIHEWARAMQIKEVLPDLTQALDAFSFWKQNPTRVYLASGSFVRWLIDTRGIDSFHQVYKGESFETIYTESASQLIEEWKEFLSKIKIDPSHLEKIDQHLHEKSFYQKKCVHEVANLLMQYSRCQGDVCKEYLNQACDLDKENLRLQKKCESTDK